MLKTATFILVTALSISAFVFSDTIFVPDDYAKIQEAIDAAVNGDTVLVKQGSYLENIDFKGKAITVMGEQGAANTVIDGNQSGSVVTCQSGEGPDSVLDGFTLTNGAADFGAGMYNNNSSPTVTNCTFYGNMATGSAGGGMCNGHSNPTVINCTFSDNIAVVGGGMFNWYSSNPTVANCTFSGNTSWNGGAPWWGGGGMCNVDNSNPIVNNCFFRKNEAYIFGGGGIYNYGSSPTVTNCTFSENTASEGGGMCNYSSNPTVTNCILWNDTSYEIYNYDSYPIITYSCIQGGYPGIGNIDSDPLFVDEVCGDFHLTFQSPCRGSGDNSAVTELYDFEGDPRICQGTVDIGADEFYRHLYCMGNFTPGGSIEGKFIGLPGATPVGLFVGSDVLPYPITTMWGDYWLQAPYVLFGPLGAIPADGVMLLPTTLPPGMAVPVDIPMQALIGLNPDSLSNLCVLEVR